MEITKIAQIARIHIEESRKQAFQENLEKVYKWMEDIKKVNVEGFEPMYNTHNHAHRTLRDDTNPEFHSPSVVLSNAPSKSDNFIIVPKVIG